jgi:hypothetical protein
MHPISHLPTHALTQNTEYTYVRTHARTFARRYRHVHTYNSRTFAHLHKIAHPPMDADKHACLNTEYSHIHIPSCIHTLTHTCTHTNTSRTHIVCARSYAQTHARMHSRTHEITHTNARIHTHISFLCSTAIPARPRWRRRRPRARRPGSDRAGGVRCRSKTGTGRLRCIRLHIACRIPPPGGSELTHSCIYR